MTKSMKVLNAAKGCHAAVGAALMAATFGASTPAHAADKPVVAVLLKTLSNPFWGAAAAGVQSGAQSSGVSVFVQAAESDQATEPQLNACNTMLERKPKALIVAAINATNLLPCLTQATSMHIPVVNMDNDLDLPIAKRAGVDVAFSIGSDNLRAGAKAADFVVGALGGSSAHGKVLVIQGIAGNSTSQARSRGFSDELAKAAPGLSIIAKLPGDWDRQKAANITNDTLQRAPDLAAIFACNDGMVLGALEAARGAGNSKVVVVGVDGDRDAIGAIRAGRLNATVAQLPYLMGQEAILDTKTLLAGGHVDPSVPVPTLVVTQEVLKAGTDPLLKDLH